jgi:cyclophilin family peptidyl-prolyl cis-trans isomerase
MDKKIGIGILVLILIIILFIIPSSKNSKSSNPMATIETTNGTITVELFKNDAPKTVENFITLAGQGFYDGTLFHRVIKDFMIQGGDPNTKTGPKDWTKHGTGGPGYAFADEFNAHKMVRGALAMANSGPNTNGSQFFIVTAESAPWLDGKHTVFGQVVSGYDVVQKIENTPTDPARGDHPLTDIVVTKVTIQ